MNLVGRKILVETGEESGFLISLSDLEWLDGVKLVTWSRYHTNKIFKEVPLGNLRIVKDSEITRETITLSPVEAALRRSELFAELTSFDAQYPDARSSAETPLT